MGKFIVGIASGVIIGLVLWYVEKPPETVVLTGSVYNNQVENSPIPNATLKFVVRDGQLVSEPSRDRTDANGVYQSEISPWPKSAIVVVTVDATGFQVPPPVSLSPRPGVYHHDFALNPIPTQTGTPAAGGQQVMYARPPAYIERQKSLVSHIALQMKKP